MKSKLTLLLCLAAPLVGFAESPRSPFGISASWQTNTIQRLVRVQFEVPSECVLYADRLRFESAAGEKLAPLHLPEPLMTVDKATGHEKKVYAQAFSVELPPLTSDLIVKFQGCSNSACFFPEKRTYAFTDAGVFNETILADPAEDPAPAVATTGADWREQATGFQVAAKESGYVTAGAFVKFLDRARSGEAQASSDPLSRFKSLGLLATMCLIVIGGLGLNLTPCILPLIPINLAIIGAGRAAQNKRTGFWNGATYGAGMALAYGILGVVVVLTGAKFGTLNSSPWFNAAIALVFGVLSLAMFGKVNLDFSRFESGLGNKLRGLKSASLVAFGLGVIAALLAGACVAPVVISVLVLAANLYGKGVVIGLLLPLLLGIGMALPWPFMGASLSLLPKPGKWMNWIKHGFGVVILLFAAYYGYLAFTTFSSQQALAVRARSLKGENRLSEGEAALVRALYESRQTGKPVFVDFKASWCKNCTAMDETVFNQSSVREGLRDFIVVEYPAEQPNQSPAKQVLDHFQVMGLPTYVVLKPVPASL